MPARAELGGQSAPERTEGKESKHKKKREREEIRLHGSATYRSPCLGFGKSGVHQATQMNETKQSSRAPNRVKAYKQHIPNDYNTQLINSQSL